MSADNWTVCPKCIAAAREEAAKAQEAVNALYGQVSIAEWDKRRAALVPVDESDAKWRTFREDYEICGAETGTVSIGYRGACITPGCELSCDLDTAKQFWPPA